ncbi:MAG: radical SAM protein [Methanotrichaceae archaeon]|nr:radical SAM protein [Methanotrichaceae archaeon]
MARVQLGANRAMNAEIKALLLSVGSANIDEKLLQEVTRTTIPSAGPGAGLESFFIKSGSDRVRLSIDMNSPLKVVRYCNGVVVIRDRKPIATGELEPALSHCPEQAYLTISGRCIYDCKFCPVPLLQGKVKSLEKIVQLVEEADQTGELSAISLTSGVANSPEEEVTKAVQILKTLRTRYNVAIGVSVYPTETSSKELYDAGATEIKYNIETMDSEIFARCCPGLSLSFVLRSLEKAVELFEKNRVSSNFILGLGESDECVLSGASKLSKMSVIPILRPISPPSPFRRRGPSAEASGGEAADAGQSNKKNLDENDLRTDKAETMCLSCTGCDITPHRDV